MWAVLCWLCFANFALYVYGYMYLWHVFNTLRPRQNGRHCTDDTFKRFFVNGNVRILIEISLKFFPKGPIINIPALVQIMAWRRPGDKPLSEPMMVCLPTHICVTRPQWVNVTYYCRQLVAKVTFAVTKISATVKLLTVSYPRRCPVDALFNWQI